MLDAPPERGLDGETFIPSAGSRRRLVFLSRTQTLAKLKETIKNEALPPTLAEIHYAPMALRPSERRRTCDDGSAGGKTLAFCGEGGGGGYFICMF